MKNTDFAAIAVFAFLVALVFFFPLGVTFSTDLVAVGTKVVCWKFDLAGCFSSKLTGLANFGDVVNLHPYFMGFLKVGILASFGEMIKTRGRTGSYKTPDLWAKFLVWGLYGMLFTVCFAIFGRGIAALADGGTIWWKPFESAAANRIFLAFSTSLWLNLVFCYPMMLSHEWCNTCIAKRRFLGGTEFLQGLDPHIWGSYLLKTIVVFWIPAHTVTFSLPGGYQILMAAFLSLALGFILTIKPKSKN